MELVHDRGWAAELSSRDFVQAKPAAAAGPVDRTELSHVSVTLTTLTAKPPSPRPARSRTIANEPTDEGGMTLLPGLINVHQHLAFDASTNPVAQLDTDDDGALLLRMRLSSQRALAVGITTIRDLGDRNYLSLTGDWFHDRRQAVADALAVGADSIEHCSFFSADGVDGEPALLQRLAASHGHRLLAACAARGNGGDSSPPVGDAERGSPR